MTAFFFVNDLDNPFPALSAIRPIAGPFSNSTVSGTKFALGLRLQIGEASQHATAR